VRARAKAKKASAVKSHGEKRRRSPRGDVAEQPLPTGNLSGGLAVLHPIDKDESGGALLSAAGALLLLVIACAASLRLTARLADAAGDFRVRPS
jgi:hypothetical protein